MIDIRIIAADDEKPALESLLSSIKKCCPDAEVIGFGKSKELLAFIENNECDIAFLDIKMQGMGGLEAAEKLKIRNGRTNIIFVTGYDNYTGTAMELHASGYIMKPVTLKKVEKELNDLRYPTMECSKKLKVRCLGNFEVYLPDGTAFRFDRAKAKELFAYLVYRRGTSCTVREIAAAIFEDKSYDKKQQTYIQQIISSLMKNLRSKGTEDVIVKTYNSLAVDPDKIDCDYYRFLNSDDEAVNAYTGEFMAQYSWAEFMNGYLERMAWESKRE
ncbi:MAG: response regulator [Huintestinicola sp.]